MITRNFNLYLNAGHSVPLVINVNQYDQGEQWVFTLYNADGTKYTPSTGAIVGIKSDGLGIINSGSVVDGNVVINETQQMTAAVGKAVFELMIDSQTHGTANFVVLVEEKPGNNADLSESDLSLLQEAIDATSPLPTGGTVGQVLTKTANGSAWSDAGTPTQEQVADAVSDWADEHITVETGVVIDTSLSVAGAAADSKAVGDELSDLKIAIQQGGSFNAEVKSALDAFTASVLQLAEKVAYIDEDGQDYYDDIDAAADSLHSAMYPPVNLSSISAVYTQSGTVYTTDSLDSLKSDLVVTATWSDSSTSTVASADYTLSGTLTEGTSTITVSYGGKTTTFTVTVTYDSAVYRLSNYAFAGGTPAVDTGIQLLNTDSSYTILLDMTRSENQNAGAGVFQCMELNSPWWGTKLQIPSPPSSARYEAISNGRTNSTTFAVFAPASNDIMRVAVRHTAGTTNAKWQMYDSTNGVKEATVGASSKTISETLKIGSTALICTINSFALYDTVLSDADVTSFLTGV